MCSSDLSTAPTALRQPYWHAWPPVAPHLRPAHREPSSGYKSSPPRARFHSRHSTPVSTTSPPHSTLSCAPPGGRNCCRRAAAALHRPRSAAATRGGRRSISGRAATLSLSFPSLLPRRASPPPHTHPGPDSSTGTPPEPRRPRSGITEEPEHAAEEPRCPSTCNSTPGQPEHSAADSDPRRRPEPARGERIDHHRAAGAVAPPVCGRPIDLNVSR